MLKSKSMLLLLAAIALPASLNAQFSQPVRDVENPAQNVYRSRGDYADPTNITTASIALAQVPAGKRLTIQTVGVTCYIVGTTPVLTLALLRVPVRLTDSYMTYHEFPIQMIRQGTGEGSIVRWIGLLSSPVYADSNSLNMAPNVAISRFPSGPFQGCSVYAHGGLTNLAP